MESPARRLMHLLSRFICYDEAVPGTLLDRVVSMGESPSKRVFNYQHVPESSVTNDGLVDSIRHLLLTDNFTKPYSHEHLLVNLHSNILRISLFSLIYAIYIEFYILYHATECIVAIYFILSGFYSPPCVFYM